MSSLLLVAVTVAGRRRCPCRRDSLLPHHCRERKEENRVVVRRRLAPSLLPLTVDSPLLSPLLLLSPKPLLSGQETLVIEETVREGDASRSRAQAVRSSVTTATMSEELEEMVETET
ncbi:hypothetical protein LWI28_006213 [Acer negundo]|uniref:Uncharacterized protein n=1 Tax=Acer negundo TaxID=4023 RepID=A0AAD5NX78_ACENE|nr:hypothetical protein LWI28_006213 [Acer negundo]